MLTIDRISGANDSRLGRRRRERRTADVSSDTAEPESRALVLVGPVVASERRPESHSQRTAPDFLAHLAATRERAPQTRAVRRAEPAEAVAVYGPMLVTPVAAGRVFRRSV